MRKFRLVKEYPGSPKLGYETPLPKGDYYDVAQVNMIHKSFLEKYPEFWQKIIEKDYEILSFTSIFNPNKFAIKHTNGKFGVQWGQFSEEDQLDKVVIGDKKIHSVKRLSDGEIFTIGDEVKYKVFGKIVNKSLSTITGFNLVGNFIHIATTTSSNWCKLSDEVLKHKKPLFTTEDGVDVFEGDWYQYLHKHSWNINTAKANKDFYKQDKYSDNSLYFSTKEKAQEYIDLHKPKYSLNDIKNCLMSTAITYYQHQVLEANLKQLNK